MIFKKADLSEKEAILALYRSVIDSEFTTWDDEYPDSDVIESDCTAGTLYVMADGDKLAGAISIVPENELDWLPLWNLRVKAREIARIAVSPAYQGHGLALEMLKEAEKILKESGCQAVHLLVACKNLPAYKTYMKAGYTVCGKCDLYGHTFYACEKKLS